MLLAERVVPTGIIACSQVTLDIAQDLYRTRNSIAFAIRSVDLFARLIPSGATKINRSRFGDRSYKISNSQQRGVYRENTMSCVDVKELGIHTRYSGRWGAER